MDPHSDFLEKNPVCLAWYCSKNTNRKTVDQRKSKFTKQEDSYFKCDQFCVDTFSLPVSLEHCNRGRPHSYSTSPHQVCRFSFVACRDVHHLLFPIFEWMDHLVVDDACIIHALFSDCLLVSSLCLVSSRSKGGIAFECSESAVRTVRARQYFTIVAGWWLMPV